MTPPFDDFAHGDFANGDFGHGDFGPGGFGPFAGGRRRDDVPPPRQFPTESEWLDLPLPPAAEADLGTREQFVDGVMQALHDEALLDASLHAFDRDLPRELLAAWDVPAPAPGFVARTMAAARDDRRTHWHHLLARYVAPDPSPQFVARTLAALAALQPPAAGEGKRPRWHRVVWPLLAAAAALVLWSVLAAEPEAPLELRIVRGTPAAFVQSCATSPLATVLARCEHAAEPDAFVTANADGVWLLQEVSR